MPKPLTLAPLCRMVIAASFRAPTTLGRVIRTMGFVQADSIRAPARARDLILRHRVADYRNGDVQRQFARLTLEQDCLYAYCRRRPGACYIHATIRRAATGGTVRPVLPPTF